MNNPFYVHVPRNHFGEHITACDWTIRSVFEPHKDLQTLNKNLNWKQVESICKKINDKYEQELMAIYI